MSSAVLGVCRELTPLLQATRIGPDGARALAEALQHNDTLLILKLKVRLQICSEVVVIH